MDEKFREALLLTHSLNDYLPMLAQHDSTHAVQRCLTYQSLKHEISAVLDGVEYGGFAPDIPYARKPYYRVVAWNLGRGLHFEGVIDVLKNHPEIKQADLLHLTETDIGMARSGNKNIAREIASELGMNYFFAPATLNLCQGNKAESHYGGENRYGLQGNAILSKYPLENLRVVRLKNCKDLMQGQEKRLGSQQTLVTEVVLPFKKITAVTTHLDAHSSHRQRALQMETIVKSLGAKNYPVLIGGDFNTSTNDTSKASCAFFDCCHKLLRGFTNVIRNHYPYPDRYFDRPLFTVLKKYGFEYEPFNELGVGTLHYDVEDLQGNQLILEVVPGWCRRVMEKTLRRYGGKVALKLDWFAGKWLRPASLDKGAMAPKVFPNLRYQGVRVSDHDPILVDIEVYS